MEKLNFFKALIDSWTNMDDKKKVSFITGTIITILCLVIYFGFIYYDNKLTEAENEKTKLRNEHTIVVNGIISRYDVLLNNEQEKNRKINEDFIKYLEKNEKETRDLLFKTERIEKRLNK